MPLRVAPVRGPAELAAALAIREIVFIRGQGVPVGLERDGQDGAADHVLCRLAGVPAGTARLVQGPFGVGVIGRVAVLPDLRGGGVGAAAVRALERCAAARGWRTVELHAQLPVVGFYRRLGYREVGVPYVEAGIDHVTMRRQVTG